ncbi:MAG TPA: ATP-dependent helicase HrpB [Pseudomonas xinjiangensis]|uniref:ATP-dependent helicase HrpB n=2 Tax=root TaxID=1 RepID=A0A7V1BNW4_9GAMM|nr:ATP-dependent helicase HrpB [Halopseudomonas xinjiangensis]HEC47641.1 ATP-dependent helicase HrpB [Halopseudomonas xinjiangensis]
MPARIAGSFPSQCSEVYLIQPTQLPVNAVLADLEQALASHPCVVLQAPPGAGKTTLVPLALLQSNWLGGQKIILLEPRRLAARAAAERLAQMLGEPVGQTVGYRIRLETRVSAATRIEVVTEGILHRLLQGDPELQGVGLVIFDEFHERSLDADLGLALCLQTQQYLREQLPLRLLVMSATLDAEAVSAMLNDAPLIRSDGRQYPVEIRYGAPAQVGQFIEPVVVQTIQQALDEESGSLLVFLPGTAEIRRVQAQLETALTSRRDVQVTPLYGELDFEAQRQAIRPAEPGWRKVVLATSIAETSLTIEGIRVVIDSGLSRQPAFDPVSGMTRLHTSQVSKASAEQRAGRAGRLEPGVCYRLWSASQQEQLAAHGQPEMLQADLAPLALQLAQWGVNDAAELSWLDLPPAAALEQGRELLERLGALERTDKGWRQTQHGADMSALPMHPRLAHMLLRGQSLGLGTCACRLAAIIGERDLLRGVQDADISRRMALFETPRADAAADRGALQRSRRLVEQWQRLIGRVPVSTGVAEPDNERWIGVLLAMAYPDRVARRRGEAGSEYRLANGRSAAFMQVDVLQKQPWLAVASLGGQGSQRSARIFLAAALEPALIEKHLPELLAVHDTLDWDPRSETLVAERQRCIGSLIFSREALPQIDPAQRNRALCEVVRRQGLALLPWTPALRQWQARIMLLRQLDLEQSETSRWPNLSDEHLLDTLEDWLAPYLEKVSRLAHFAGLDLSGILVGLLPWPLPKELDAQAPSHWTVPTGSSIRIDYSQQPPVLAVRLQEMFGSTETPRVANGRMALKLHLLSPAQRPVQVTQDLAGFWAGSYAEVKKDMKGRYPKHYWPDDPSQAEPTRRAKPRKD